MSGMRSFHLTWSMWICFHAYKQRLSMRALKNLHIIWDFLLIRANLHFRMPVATSQMKSWNCVKPFNLLALPKRWTSQLVYQIVTRRKLLKRLLTRQQVLQRKYLLEETTIRAEGKSPLSYLLQGVQSSLVSIKVKKSILHLIPNTL